MKRFFYILLSVSVLLIATLQTLGQNLPSACVGSTERYWVKGFNGHSDFTWKVTDPDGNVVPPSDYTLVGRGDTIQIEWKNTLKGGIYTFEVIESSHYGCNGEPYTQNIVLNSPTINIPFEGVPTSVAVCFGNIAELDPGLFKNYLWQDGSTNRIYYTGEAGTFQVRLIDNNQSCSYNEIEAKINPLPYLWLGKDTVLFGGESLVLNVSDPNISVYKWNITNNNVPSVTVTGQEGNQRVWVTVTDLNGCENSDTILISTSNYKNLRIPAAFTPNGDGVNDKWFFPAPPKNTKIDLYPSFDEVEVRVFNRWGKLVWESSGSFVAWDGRDLKGNHLPMDSYHYIIKFKIDGKSYLYKGSITIVR